MGSLIGTVHSTVFEHLKLGKAIKEGVWIPNKSTKVHKEHHSGKKIPVVDRLVTGGGKRLL